MRWTQYFTPLRYSLEILIKNEFDDNSKYPINVNIKFNYDLGVAS